MGISANRPGNIVPGSVGQAEIGTDGVAADEIAAGAVGQSEIATDGVAAAEIEAGAVGTSEIATDGVAADEIAAGAVGASEIATDAVGADEIALDAVGPNEIAAGAVGEQEIGTNAVGSDEIADNAVDSGHLAGGSVGSDEVGTGAIGADELAAGSLTAADAAADLATQAELDAVSTVANAAVPKSLIDAAGDLIYGSAADTVARLAAGSNGQVLTLAAGLPSWAAAAGGSSGGMLAPVTSVHTAGNITVSNPGTMTYGGTVCTVGQRVLLTAQSTASQNGIWVVGATTATALTRPTDYAAAATIPGGTNVPVAVSVSHPDTIWMLTTDGDIIVDTTSTTWTTFYNRSHTWSSIQTFSAGVTMAGQYATIGGLTLGVTTFSGNQTTNSSALFRLAYTGAGGHTLTLGYGAANSRMHLVTNDGAGLLTITRSGSDTFTGGLTSIVLRPGETVIVAGDGGTNWRTSFSTPNQGVQAFAATGTIDPRNGLMVTFAGAAAQTLTLPAAVVGTRLEVWNIDSADSVDVARAGSDTINGGTAAVACAAGATLVLLCTSAGAWITRTL